MKRVMLTVAYDGTGYSGWQIQPNAPTIEEELDKAILKLTGEQVHVVGASRTDAGVHGMGNVAVFDTESTIPGDRFSYAINQLLPEDISVVASKEVPADFHPRHCNTRKTYEYKILCSRHAVPQLRNQSWFVPFDLNVDAMSKAAKALIGEHDFKSFCCVRTQAESTIRTIYDIEVEAQPNTIGKIVTIRVTGNGFLYNMVRIIAGTLVGVGKGQFEDTHIQDMLDAKDRCSAGQTAPPQGLTLMKIDYVDGDDIL